MPRGAAEAQNNPKNELSGGAARVMLDLQRRWVEALMKADTPALDTILVDTYVDTDEGGNRYDKVGVLAMLKSGDLELASIKLSDTQVHRYGDSAVLTGAAAKPERSRGSPSRQRYYLPPCWFWKMGSGERPQRIGLPCALDR
jgi:hypothetical protein